MDRSEAFKLAVTQGDTVQAAALLEQDPALVNLRTEQGTSMTLLALYYGQPAIARWLAFQGAEVSLLEAAALGRLEDVQRLVVADPTAVNRFSSDGFQALGYAAFFGQPEVALYLLEHGAEPDTPSRNPMLVRPLHSATASGQLAIAQALLAHGADANAAQQQGFRPLHAAAQNGQREMVELLLHHGADPAARSDDGRSAADFAREAGHVELVELLDA